jgi:hypothetical protein
VEPTRLDRIEAILEATATANAAWQKDMRRAMDGLIESQTLAQKSVGTLTESVSKYVDAASGYVAESNARMKRIEENLDGLIRAITAEHSNGKGKN